MVTTDEQRVFTYVGIFVEKLAASERCPVPVAEMIVNVNADGAILGITSRLIVSMSIWLSSSK